MQFFIIAQQAVKQAPSMGDSFMSMLPAFLLAFLIFHFMVIKPQQKRIKEQEGLITGLKKSDTVVTSSGIVGKVSAIEEGFITLEVASNVRMKFEASHVVKKVEQTAAA